MTFLRAKQKRRMGVKPERPNYEPHLKWVRSHFACLVEGRAGHVCQGLMRAHHVRENTGAGTGLKPPDFWVIPLCDSAHREGHDKGWRTFERKYGVDTRAEAQKAAEQSPHKHRWLAHQSTEKE